MSEHDESGFAAAQEVTGRTARVIEAETRAYDAQMGVVGLKRQLARVNWVWGVLAFLVAIVGVGYALRDQVEHFATKETVDKHEEEIERLREWQRQIDEHERSRDEMITRMSGQLDRLYEHLMREKGRRE